MSVTNVHSHPKVKASDIPLEKLATTKALTQEEKAAEMTRQFESMLLRQILTEAQKPSIPSKLASNGVTTSIYKDMSVTQMADTISSSRSLGLSQELEKQLSRQLPGHQSVGLKPGSPAAARQEPGGPVAAKSQRSHESQTKHAAQPPIHLTKTPRL